MKIPQELLTVARYLGHLTEKTVFVGGMIRGLLITDPAAGVARPTDDVDLIVDVPSYKAFTDLNEELRGLGFNESMGEGAPICRWVVAGIRTDIMPIDPGILGFTNVWYSGAMDHPAVIAGQRLRLFRRAGDNLPRLAPRVLRRALLQPVDQAAISVPSGALKT